MRRLLLFWTLFFGLHCFAQAQIDIPGMGRHPVQNGYAKTLRGETLPYFSIYPDYARRRARPEGVTRTVDKPGRGGAHPQSAIRARLSECGAMCNESSQVPPEPLRYACQRTRILGVVVRLAGRWRCSTGAASRCG